MGILALRIIDGPVPLVVEGIAVIALLAVLARRPPRGRPVWRWVLELAAIAGLGAGVGVLACWVFGDLLDLFGVGLTLPARGWVAGAFAGVALGIVGLVRHGVPRRVVGGVAIVASVLAGTLGVNAAFGQYTTVASVFDLSTIPALPGADLNGSAQQPGALPVSAGWSAPVGMPAKGLVGSVTIPATVSGFHARPAVVYLPPAARTAHPPALPVVMLMSGQPGSPEDLFGAGKLERQLDAYAADHGGLAPIVVVPDQLGAPNRNPMCVDSVIGDSATYLTVDVPAWIRTHLTVLDGPEHWAIGGWSQGGTCAIQLGAAHPELFSVVLDVSGELAPAVGSVDATIAAGFGGDEDAYQAALPQSILAAKAPYPADSFAVFAYGELDTKYGPGSAVIEAAAREAGWQTALIESPGTAHDWYTVRYAWGQAFPELFAHLGLVAG